MKHSTVFVAALVLLLAACDPDEPVGTADFTTATDPQKLRAIMAGAGFDSVIAIESVTLLIGAASQPGTTCPTLVENGEVTTLTGNCGVGQSRIDGRVVVTSHVEQGKEQTSYELEQLAIINGSEPPVSFDGTIAADEAAQTLDIDLDAVVGALGRARSQLSLRCVDDGRCTPDGEARIDVDGLGTATVSGSWRLDDDHPTEASAVELHGKNLLRADLAAADSDDCLPITIDGADAGKVCAPREADQPMPHR